MNFHTHTFTSADGLQLYVRDSGPAEGKPTLVLLHSLSDNGRVFDAVIAAGLEQHFRLVLPDGRGRGKSARPETGYELDRHAEDLRCLLDELNIRQAIIAGHSFGAFLALHFAAKYPQRTAGLAMIDAAAELNPLTPMFILAMTDRLGRWYPSVETYISSLRAAPFMTLWDERMRAAFLEDTHTLPNGALYVLTQKHHMTQASADIMRYRKHDWRTRALAYAGPALVLVAQEPFLMGNHICEAQKALETTVLLSGGVQEMIPGNHITMLYGAGAVAIAATLIARFTGTEKVLPVVEEIALTETYKVLETV